MFSLKQSKIYCFESIDKIANYIRASQSDELYDIHHRFEDMGLSQKDLIQLGMYYNRPACELIFIPRKEHTSLHSNRFRNESLQKKRMSNWSRNAWKDDNFRKKQKENLHRVQNTLEYRQHLSNGITQHFEENEDAHIQRSLCVRKQWNNPDRRSKQSNFMKSLWQNSTYRNKALTSRKAMCQDTEYIKKLSNASKSKWNDPSYVKLVMGSRNKMSIDYKAYKLSGGVMNWNAWRKSINQKNKTI